MNVKKIKLSINYGITKMYQILKQYFWWSNINKYVPRYVSSSLIC